jgi:carboxypeptidase C (cathepsin A)
MLSLALIIAIALATDPFLGEKLETGSIVVKGNNSTIFYVLFKARTPKSENPPLILWIAGGPGCSGMYAAWAEVGPYNVTEMPDPQLVSNPYSWTQYNDVLFIDQPVGVGYSKANADADLCTTTSCNAYDIMVFLNKFGTLHPQYTNSNFYIAGVSYGGHTVPQLGEYMLRNDGPLKLKGILIGNGWVDPINQLYDMPNYAYANKLIGFFRYILSWGCFFLAKIFILLGADNLSELFGDEYCYYLIVGDPPRFDDNKIKGVEIFATDESVINFLWQPKIRQLLNTTNISFFEEGSDYICNDDIYGLYVSDEMISLLPSVQYLLSNNISILIYSGDLDFVCNWMQQESWISNMDWDGHSEYVNQEYKVWKVGDKEFGRYKKAKNLLNYIIKDAGHMAPFDQPEAVWELINMFVV